MVYKKKWTAVALLAAGIIIVCVFSLLKKDVEYTLTFGEKIVDLGIQQVGDDNYTTKSEIKLKNNNSVDVTLLSINKPCVCQTVEFTPSDSPVAPDNEGLLYFAYSKDTDENVGYFLAPVKLRLAIGEGEGDMFVKYSGFALKGTYFKPEKLVFRNMQKGDTSKVEMVYLFLSRLMYKNNKLTIQPLQNLRIADKPGNIDAKIISDVQGYELHKLAPKIVLPNFKNRRTQDLTKTEKELRRFFNDNDLDGESLWQVFAIAIRAANVENSIDDFIKFETGSSVVQLPVKISLMPELSVQPKTIAFTTAAKSFKAIITVKNTLGQPITVNKVAADYPQIILSTKRVSKSEYRIIVDYSVENSTVTKVSSKISIETSVGTDEVQYKIVSL